jgi:hypothetical protein
MSGLEWTPDVSMYRQPWRESAGACLRAPAGEGMTMTDVGPGPENPRWRPPMFELWQQAGGDGERYRELLHEWGYVLRPGDKDYEDASPALPCGWPRGEQR